MVESQGSEAAQGCVCAWLAVLLQVCSLGAWPGSPQTVSEGSAGLVPQEALGESALTFPQLPGCLQLLAQPLLPHL